MPMKRKEIDQFLSKPNVAVIAVTDPDGHPHAVPTWYDYKAGVVTIHSDTTAFKYKCLQKNPYVGLCVDAKTPPYKAVILKGRVSLEAKEDYKRFERMAISYLGKKQGLAYAKTLKGNKVGVITFRPEKIISWDYARDPL
jgi:nitroimidazol reductase NimA-like FMN-containing flavoprotein (pyridoxamine 5'-phosphate oxidase superfamily)